MSRVAKAGLTLSVGVTLLGLAMIPGGCSAPEFRGIEDLPLPGGADLGGNPYEVTAEFQDVVSLVPQATVKVNDVAVGEVSDISLDDEDWTARVTMRINGKVRLPANTYANLEQSSLLGEKYVQLSAPSDMRARPDMIDTEIGAKAAYDSDSGRLEHGGVIPLSRTNRNPEVEEVFGALSMLLNGGGVAQIRNITGELNDALGGNEAEARDMLRQVATLTKDLDENKKDITDALDGVNELSATLAARDKQIGEVLEDLSPGLKVLREQRGALVTMLRSLDKLSGVAVDTVDASKEDIVADLEALAPVLRNLADAGKDLPDSLEVLFTYPFTDEVLNGVKGDYLNVYLNLAAAPGTQVIPELRGGTDASSSSGAPLPLPAASDPVQEGDAS